MDTQQFFKKDKNFDDHYEFCNKCSRYLFDDDKVYICRKANIHICFQCYNQLPKLTKKDLEYRNGYYLSSAFGRCVDHKKIECLMCECKIPTDHVGGEFSSKEYYAGNFIKNSGEYVCDECIEKYF